MNVLSLFDGMSCGQIALERAGIEVTNYFASEIDKYAIKVTQANYPSTIQIGDVTKVSYKNGILYTDNGQYNVGKIDLVMGGSPCQGFSFAGKQLNFDDPRSALFFEWLRICHEVCPDYFLLENVKMKKEYQDVITHKLGVDPIEINSSLVSAQNRQRLYWTNLQVSALPEDKGINFCSIKEITVDKKYYLSEVATNRALNNPRNRTIHNYHSKSGALLANQHKQSTDSLFYACEGLVRKLTPIECERLQTVTDSYTNHVSATQRYKMLGNGWTVDVIAHIFKNIK